MALCERLANGKGEIVPKKSASRSEVLLAVTNTGRPVAVKFWRDIKSLDYERDIYRCIVTTLKNNHCGYNLVDYVASGKCALRDLAPKTVDPQAFRQYIKEASVAARGASMNTKVNVLITSRPPSPIPSELASWTLGKGMVNIDMDEHDVYAIVFQVLFMLNVFQSIRLMHHDMHIKNILLEVRGQPVTLVFETEDQLYLVRTRYIPRIFDWDFGFHYLLGANPRLAERCPRTYQCNFFQERMDMLIFVCMVVNHIKRYPGLKAYAIARLLDMLNMSNIEMKALEHRELRCRFPKGVPDKVPSVKEALAQFVEYRVSRAEAKAALREGAVLQMVPTRGDGAGR